MSEIKRLIDDRKNVMMMLKDIESDLMQEVYNLPIAVQEAIAYGIVKPNFPMNPYFKRELQDRFNNEK